MTLYDTHNVVQLHYHETASALHYSDQMLKPRFGDSVRHFIFQHRPLKTTERPGSLNCSSAATVSRCDGTGACFMALQNVPEYLKELTECRNTLLGLMFDQTSNPTDVKAALDRWVGIGLPQE